MSIDWLRDGTMLALHLTSIHLRNTTKPEARKSEKRIENILVPPKFSLAPDMVFDANFFPKAPARFSFQNGYILISIVQVSFLS